MALSMYLILAPLYSCCMTMLYAGLRSGTQHVAHFEKMLASRYISAGAYKAAFCGRRWGVALGRPHPFGFDCVVFLWMQTGLPSQSKPVLANERNKKIVENTSNKKCGSFRPF